MKSPSFETCKLVFEQLLRNSGLTRAVLFSILSQAWLGLAGPVTILVVARTLNPAGQGFYYTFSSLLGIQVFFELGLATVIVQTASHEWAGLRRAADGEIEGTESALSRLASLGRFGLYWYSIASVLFLFALIVGGDYFFAAKAADYTISWRSPWILLGIAMSLQLLSQPLFSLIEGCNQVSSLYGARLLQAIVSSLGIIVALYLGGGLYSLAVGAGLRLLVGILWLSFRQRAFLVIVLKSKVTAKIDWRQDVWPFQWRIAVSWLSGYIIFSIITPVMFQFRGPIVAGQMGMSLVLAGAIESIACAWLNTRSPQFGVLVAQRKFQALDELFKQSLRVSLIIAAIGVTIISVGVMLLKTIEPIYAARLLPIVPLVLLMIYRVTNVGITGMALYLRAHKREPLMNVSVINAIIAGLSLWTLGKTYGPTGAIIGSLAASLIWSLPACYSIFRHCRIDWHRPT